LEKRETIINNLCKLAENLFSNVQQTAKGVESNNNKVTDNTEQALTIIKTTRIQPSGVNRTRGKKENFFIKCISFRKISNMTMKL
jgi:hypothetical protein